jgi:L-lactate dehydrogenase complex protein LldF
VHLVLLDNGRTRVYADLELRETLRCIRCGACMNHCPVYARVGGHTYDAVYPGPIGKILTPQIAGLDVAEDLPHASSLCNACVEVCPVKIPIADILVRLRREAVRPSASQAVKGGGSGWTLSEASAWAGWKWLNAHPALYRAAGRVLAAMGNLIPSSMPPLKAWTSVRAKPKFAPKTLHQLARDKGFDDV